MNKKQKKILKILKEASDIYIERSNVYGDAHERHSKIMVELFPNGLILKTPEDYGRYTFISSVISKINRYAENIKKGGHRDSAIDPINMLAMLVEFDERNKK